MSFYNIIEPDFEDWVEETGLGDLAEDLGEVAFSALMALILLSWVKRIPRIHRESRRGYIDGVGHQAALRDIIPPYPLWVNNAQSTGKLFCLPDSCRIRNQSFIFFSALPLCIAM